jgi:glycogen(starch) synthase
MPARAEFSGPGLRTWPGVVLFEVAWEVCNQIGGIYTVLRSKAPSMVERWRRHYCAVGPWVPDKAALEFEPVRPSGWHARALKRLEAQGLRAHHGRWLVPGKPRVILLEHGLSTDALNDLKYRLWRDFAIESPGGDSLIDDTLCFGEAVRKLLEAACAEWLAEEGDARARPPHRVLAHCHEWLGSLAIPLTRAQGLPLATVFTTHATSVGRYIASSEERFYDLLPTIDAAAEATRYGISCQHQIERACMQHADLVTTVSPIAGEECAALLGRAPDAITPNGLNVDLYDVGHDFQTLHAQFKERIHLFTMGHFFPSYPFDLDRTLYFFTSGRFEPRNKGFDLCIAAMARLNAELKAADLGVTAILFVVTQRPVRSIHPRALHTRGVLDELRDVSRRVTADLAERLFRRGAAGERFRLEDLVDEYWLLRFRRTQHALHTDRLPLVATHVLENEASDPLLAQIEAAGLRNAKDDPVKIVYHPEFVTTVNPLWGIEYDQFVRGCHLGIFPSVYEPWGYTPLECVAMGVPAITSDLTGFGRYVSEVFPDHDRWGLTVLRRRGRTYHDAAADLARRLLAFCRLDRRERIALRNDVLEHAADFDWSHLGEAYHEVHDRALELPAPHSTSTRSP